MDELLKSLAEQVPLVMVLLYWLRQEHNERIEERSFFRRRIDALLKIILGKDVPGDDPPI